LAAAIKINADLIVTNNLKDFPIDYLATFGLKAKSPDDFFTDIIDLNQELSVSAFNKLVLNKRNPPYNDYEVLDILRNNGLNDTANYLHALL
jgi:protein tyrosine phosphatase